MRKAIIYKPSKSAMQSGRQNSNKWLLEFDTINKSINPLMGWESSRDTMSELKLKFSTKDLAIDYARNNNIQYKVIESQKRKLVKKSYTDNFIK